MKKISLIAGILIILSSYIVYATSSSASTISVITESYRINATLVSQEPGPVEPGKYVDLRFKFENRGSENAEDITVELLPKYPFSLEPGDSAVKKIGSVNGRQVGDLGVIVKYRLRVDKDAIEGDNEIEIRYKIADGAWTKLEPFTVSVKAHQAIISIDKISYAGERIKQGETSSINITLKNTALSLVKDIKVKLDFKDVSIAPYQSSNEQIIKQLAAGEEITLNFRVIAEPDADSKVYKVPLKMEYADRQGANYTRESTIGLVVGSDPDLSVVLDSTEIYSSRKGGNIIIKFVNKGVTDIKFLNVKLRPSNDYKVINADEAYVGDIDSDDYETAEFKVYVNPTKKDDIQLALLIEYKDANNQEYAKETNIPLKLYSSSEIKKYGLGGGNSKAGIFISIAIVILGLFFYRKLRRKKGKKL